MAAPSASLLLLLLFIPLLVPTFVVLVLLLFIVFIIIIVINANSTGCYFCRLPLLPLLLLVAAVAVLQVPAALRRLSLQDPQGLCNLRCGHEAKAVQHSEVRAEVCTEATPPAHVSIGGGARQGQDRRAGEKISSEQ